MSESIKRPDFSEDDGIAAVDLLGFFKRYFLWIIACGVAGAVVAFIVSLCLPNQWLATGVVQLGQLDDRPPIPLDTQPRALVRLQSHDFQNQILKTMGLPQEANDSRDTYLLRNTLTGQAQPNTDLIMITARGYSPELALRTVTEAQNALIAQDSIMFAPYIDRAQKRIVLLDAEIHNAEQLIRTAPNDTSASAHSADSNQAVLSALLGNMLQSDMRQQEVAARKLLEDLQQQRMYATRTADPAYAFNTRPVTNVSVSTSPVSPHRSVMTAFGLILGLVLGIISGLFLHIRRRARTA